MEFTQSRHQWVSQSEKAETIKPNRKITQQCMKKRLLEILEITKTRWFLKLPIQRGEGRGEQNKTQQSEGSWW